MDERARKATIRRLQQLLRWALVLDVIPGRGWVGIGLGGELPVEVVPIRYFVKLRNSNSEDDLGPRIILALEGPDGRLLFDDGSEACMISDPFCEDFDVAMWIDDLSDRLPDV